jgi:hypothetical protein
VSHIHNRSQHCQYNEAKMQNLDIVLVNGSCHSLTWWGHLESSSGGYLVRYGRCLVLKHYPRLYWLSGLHSCPTLRKYVQIIVTFCSTTIEEKLQSTIDTCLRLLSATPCRSSSNAHNNYIRRTIWVCVSICISQDELPLLTLASISIPSQHPRHIQKILPPLYP